MPHDTYAAARNAEYTFPSPLYVSLIAACVDSRVCTKRDGTGGINFCRCGYISVPSSFVRLNSSVEVLKFSSEIGKMYYSGSHPPGATVAHATHQSVGVRSGRKCLMVPLDEVTA